VEATPRGGLVRIEIETHDAVVRMAVRNPLAVPLALREAFFRKYASSGKKSGSGLGAYSARLMAETQRGRIEMSTSDELGTVVTVSLERAGNPSSTDSQARPEAQTRVADRAGRRVLIADDDEPTRFVLARFIGETAAVAFAADGEQALHQIEGFDPAVVVLDAEMPVLDGPSTATRLRAIDQASGRPRRLIVGLSAHDDAAMRAAFLDAGCDVVLAKPVTRAALLEAVLACGPAPEPTPGDAPDASEVVGVEADLLPMIPAFLQSRREQAKDLAAALDDEALERARALAHKLRGGLEMCGFMKAGALSRTIEDHLSSGRPAREIAGQVRVLRDYLDHVRYEPRPASS
ncbi:MAG: response regulator, partial [Vicinamibacteria bacterium]|nr:response regulator [Vicinamibacteria bacterium]